MMRFSVACIGTIVFLSSLQPGHAIEPKGEEKPAVAQEITELRKHVEKLSARLAHLEQQLKTADKHDKSKEKHKAKTTEQARVYAMTYKVSDIVPTIKGDFAEAYDFDHLIHYITTTIAPAKWDKAGGRGAIAAYPQNRSLVVSQTVEVHKEIAQWMAEFRQAKKVMEDFQKTVPRKRAAADDSVSSL